MEDASKDIIYSPTKIRTFEIVAEVNGFLEGGVEDWPAQMQDAVYAALEAKAKQVQLPLAIVHSYCAIDHGDTEAQDKPFVHIIASEIIAADNRFMRAEKSMLKGIIGDIVAGRRTQ